MSEACSIDRLPGVLPLVLPPSPAAAAAATTCRSSVVACGHPCFIVWLP